MPAPSRSPSRLPPELIWHIIENLLPSNTLAILPPSSSATKTLLSFTLVSHSTNPIATRLLRQRCMHIDSSRRLSQVLLTLLAAPRPATLPPVFSLKCITSLYLGPFGRSLDDKSVALWIRELFCEVCATLRRLVIDWPWQSLDPFEDHLDILPTLRDGIGRLAGLEKLVLLRAFPALPPHVDSPACFWYACRDIRRLVLFGVPMGLGEFWKELAGFPKLEQVVFVRSLSLEGTNIKKELCASDQSALDGKVLFSTPVRIVLADVENEMPEVVTDRWAEYDPAGLVRVEKYYIPTSFYGDDDINTALQHPDRRALPRISPNPTPSSQLIPNIPTPDMPDKNLTTISYAAGASLAAIALVYVFAPTFTIDETSTSSSRRKGVVGLRNAANDCFINSTLQALAGLGELRIYLIRETHRRNIDDDGVYSQLVQPPGKNWPDWKIEGMQRGLVTQGLKDMLDSLNERPIYKKSISAIDFVRVLETAFRQRISRQQQDAQEFLQIVAERLKDEYHAGERAREHARLAASAGASVNGEPNGDAVQQKLENLNLTNGHSDESTSALPTPTVPKIQTNGIHISADEDEGFPMEGRYESQSECQTCGYKTKPREETFYMLTLNVPQTSSTTLSACFDEIFKTEMIDDFKCERCRLIHGEESLKKDLAKAKNESEKQALEEAIRKLRVAIDGDPEHVPDDILLPDISTAPKRRIARSTRLTSFPRILAVHLSRSIYDTTSTKNSAKVAFPERLPLGGLRDRRNYKLLGLVTHKGSHHSGHYESFRRQNTYAPYSNQNTFQPSGIYSKTASPAATPQPSTPQLGASPAVSTPDLLTPSSETNSSTPSLSSSSNGSPRDRIKKRLSTTSAPRDRQKEPDSGSIRSVKSLTASAKSTVSKISQRVNGNSTPGSSPPRSTPMAVAPRPPVHKRKKQATDRWWRISDEKVREAKTSDVLDLRREVYLLFYELERDSP
ncbi:ubiquitin carboxyl-terminal hydrolase [Colletotrichum karsti]|uniref:Ubiquitin carboxyl-terminal hydrolase n=1 Tax=Colletotrichum karsti TaxID=1095194 RepID=A0A9P6I578_9PEZI|nr:ubiquitin carboxyl-terminal hydrolase [Colletotrichum karsti]KAF9876618.1 ubiquitin carboxyl-terminal hydrolase [Colletotrichum karsti]